MTEIWLVVTHDDGIVNVYWDESVAEERAKKLNRGSRYRDYWVRGPYEVESICT